jgi:hypothetical protein
MSKIVPIGMIYPPFTYDVQFKNRLVSAASFHNPEQPATIRLPWLILWTRFEDSAMCLASLSFLLSNDFSGFFDFFTHRFPGLINFLAGFFNCLINLFPCLFGCPILLATGKSENENPQDYPLQVAEFYTGLTI